jgi:hypothetical protein
MTRLRITQDQVVENLLKQGKITWLMRVDDGVFCGGTEQHLLIALDQEPLRPLGLEGEFAIVTRSGAAVSMVVHANKQTAMNDWQDILQDLSDGAIKRLEAEASLEAQRRADLLRHMGDTAKAIAKGTDL